GERPHVGGAGGRVVGPPVQHVRQQVDAVRAERGAGGDQPRQPRVPAHDGPALLADRHQVGQPVAGRRGQLVLGGGRVHHQVEQVVPVAEVAVEGGGAGVELG